MRIITARELIRPSQRRSEARQARSESRTVQIVLSGRWLEEIGFNPGQPVYVGIVGDTVTLSPTAPEAAQLTPLEEIKRKYAQVGIPTTPQSTRSRATG